MLIDLQRPSAAQDASSLNPTQTRLVRKRTTARAKLSFTQPQIRTQTKHETKFPQNEPFSFVSAKCSANHRFCRTHPATVSCLSCTIQSCPNTAAQASMRGSREGDLQPPKSILFAPSSPTALQQLPTPAPNLPAALTTRPPALAHRPPAALTTRPPAPAHRPPAALTTRPPAPAHRPPAALTTRPPAPAPAPAHRPPAALQPWAAQFPPRHHC